MSPPSKRGWPVGRDTQAGFLEILTLQVGIARPYFFASAGAVAGAFHSRGSGPRR